MLLALPPLLFINEFAWYAIVALGFSSHGPRVVYLRSKTWIDRAAGTGVAYFATGVPNDSTGSHSAFSAVEEGLAAGR